MDVLKVGILGLVVASCYQPELESCAVSCADGAGCPEGMICGSGSLCVFSADETCPATSAVDVQIYVSGKGLVSDPDSGIHCDSACAYALPVGVELELVPEARGKARFEGWREEPCEAFSFACEITLDPGGLVATAEFKGGDDDD